MKKIILSIALAAFAASTASARDMLIVGQDYPPFNYEENGQVIGGMADVMKKVCEDLKHKCTFKIIPLARNLKMLEDGEADAVLSLIPNADRTAYSNFSPTVIITDVSYLGKKGIPKAAKLQDMAGWNVAGVRAASSLKLAQKQNDESGKKFNMLEEVSNETLVQKLHAGAYGAKGVIVGSEDVLRYFAKKIGVEIDPAFKMETQDFMIAFGKKKVNADELAALNKSIESLKKSGEVKKILSKYNLRTKD